MQPSFPQTFMPTCDHTDTHQCKQAYVFLCLIRGNVKMTPMILRQQQRWRGWMKEMGAAVFTHHRLTGTHNTGIWSGALGIPVSYSGKWFVIPETRGMIQNLKEGHRGQQYLLRLHYRHTPSHTRRFNLSQTLTSPHPRLWYPSPLLSFTLHAIQ